MKLSELKQKIKDNVTKERVIAAVGVVVGVAGAIVAERYRREYDKLLFDDSYFEEKVDRGEEIETVPVHRALMDEVRAGATLMHREKRRQDGSVLAQNTTLPEWTEDADEQFQEP